MAKSRTMGHDNPRTLSTLRGQRYIGAFGCAAAVGGVKAGDIQIDCFTLEHADAMMRQLPAEAKRPATRRQYAKAIHRVLALAVCPLRLITATPLPRGWLPKIGKPPARQYLYPDEDSLLMACMPELPEQTGVPLCYRVFFGALAREGARASELASVRLGVDIDLNAGPFGWTKTRATILAPGRSIRESCARCGAGVSVGGSSTASWFSSTNTADRLKLTA